MPSIDVANRRLKPRIRVNRPLIASTWAIYNTKRGCVTTRNRGVQNPLQLEKGGYPANQSLAISILRNN
jgi:hypothetical protein